MTSRTGRVFVRLPRPTLYSLAELALLILVAVQTARLFWVLVAPVGPVGDWRPQSALAAPGDGATLANFDPFFRLSAAAGPAVVTSLNLKLHGTREDRASGRGSAIIALPDGRQMSFAVGEEIMPGVILAQVAFDNVTINRGGALEQIFLDQSSPTPAIGEVAATTAPPAPGQPQPAAAPAAAPPGQTIGLQPRLAGGRINGIIVSPGSDGGQAFRTAGFAPGDVIVSVNGQPVTSLEQARSAMGAGREVTVMVDRGGRAIPMRVRLNP